MVRLAISVEGPTEFEFCREMIRPHLQEYGIYADAKIVMTKRNISGPNSKGGSISLQRVVNEIKPLLHSFDYVTTLYDFYGFKDREPGEENNNLCKRISEALGTPHTFIPYVQVYEFEAFLFAGPDKVGHYMQSDSLANKMRQIVDTCGGPEDVNDSPVTAPSRRLETIFQEHLQLHYDKKFYGPLLALDIGLASIRSGCPRFNAWLLKLENLE